MASIIASGPRRPWFISQHFQTNSDDQIVDVTEVNQERCLEESGQWLEMLIEPIQFGQWQASTKKYQF